MNIEGQSPHCRFRTGHKRTSSSSSSSSSTSIAVSDIGRTNRDKVLERQANRKLMRLTSLGIRAPWR